MCVCVSFALGESIHYRWPFVSSYHGFIFPFSFWFCCFMLLSWLSDHFGYLFHVLGLLSMFRLVHNIYVAWRIALYSFFSVFGICFHAPRHIFKLLVWISNEMRRDRDMVWGGLCVSRNAEYVGFQHPLTPGGDVGASPKPRMGTWSTSETRTEHIWITQIGRFYGGWYYFIIYYLPYFEVLAMLGRWNCQSSLVPPARPSQIVSAFFINNIFLYDVWCRRPKLTNNTRVMVAARSIWVPLEWFGLKHFFSCYSLRLKVLTVFVYQFVLLSGVAEGLKVVQLMGLGRVSRW